MTIRLSSGIRDSLISNYGLGAMLSGGHIRIYSGEQPSSADAPPTGVLLAKITQNGAPVPGLGELKLRFGAAAGELVNDGAWRMSGIADGIPGWWRFSAKNDLGGSSGVYARIDGSISECVLDMPALITSSANTPVGGFSISIPSN